VLLHLPPLPRLRYGIAQNRPSLHRLYLRAYRLFPLIGPFVSDCAQNTYCPQLAMQARVDAEQGGLG
jgi:hypothetical protein